VFIGQLREKLGSVGDGAPDLIRNEPGIGYRLDVEML
jgi:DNA-binding response OmpR family regulator